jgi:hypothetical protein
MPTVSKEIADQIIANKGHYGGDPVVLVIIEYDNMFDGTPSYGLCYSTRDVQGYLTSRAVLNPRVIYPPEVVNLINSVKELTS